MARFTDYEFFLYAFGPKEVPLTDERLEKGIMLVAEKLIANKLASKQELQDPFVYMTMCHATLQQWIRENYNVSNLDKTADFMTKKAEDFYNDKEHNRIRLNISTLTATKSVLVTSVYTDIMDYYYKSGACLRNQNNKEAHAYDSFFANIDGLEEVSENTKTLLKNKRERLSSYYPTKEQMKEAYRDYLTATNASGLDENVFKDPMVNGQKDDRYLTEKEKTAIAKSLGSAATKNAIKNAYTRAFGMQVLTRDELEAVYRPYYPVNGYFDTKHNYERFSGLLKERGNMNDKENVETAINCIKALKELHAKRPWYQKFFFWLGDVGKENQLADQLTANLVKRGISQRLLSAALDGNAQAKKQIMDALPTKEVRIKEQESLDRANFFQALRLHGPDDERIITKRFYNEKGEPEYCKTYIKVDDTEFELPDAAVYKYLTKDMLNKEAIDNDRKYQSEEKIAVDFIDNDVSFDKSLEDNENQKGDFNLNDITIGEMDEDFKNLKTNEKEDLELFENEKDKEEDQKEESLDEEDEKEESLDDSLE